MAGRCLSASTLMAELCKFSGHGPYVRRDIHDLRPRDMIDLQSFLWVIGSDEYTQ